MRADATGINIRDGGGTICGREDVWACLRPMEEVVCDGVPCGGSRDGDRINDGEESGRGCGGGTNDEAERWCGKFKLEVSVR